EKNQTTNNPTPALAIPQSRRLISTQTMSKTLATLKGKSVPLHMNTDSFETLGQLVRISTILGKQILSVSPL
ncbi:MAG: hypothetical protein Q9M33_06335, partial [Robiginitomaculum sp.]|nr:hypothetical protein [Robiginitomaculum sp.]